MELEALSQDVFKSQEEIDAYQVEIIELQERMELAKSNGLFFVDQDGSLRTNQMLDYEVFSDHPFLPILVQATDENNFTMTKHFMVEVTDEQFEPDFDTFGLLQIEENRPVGSLVGQFNSSNIEPFESFSYSVLSFEDDPVQIQERIFELEALSLDVLKSQEEIDAYQVEIIELQERMELAKSNGLFFVDQNGSLRTNQILEYETFSEHPFLPILVQATDEHNFTITKYFMVEVIDRVTEPVTPLPAIVRTFNSADINEFSYLLEAEVLADGGSLIHEVGFLISKSIRFIDPIRIIARFDPLTGEFSAEFLDFEPGTRYYFRGYAFNDFGESKGSIKKFRTPEIIDPDAWWNNMTDVGDGWRNSEWFGAFLIYPELDWIYHSDLDWVYVVKDEGNGIWIWHPQHGWLWTQDMVWPYLYSNRTSNWIYFMNKMNGQPIIYDYETGRYLVDFKSPTEF
jgi:cell division protein FtsL